MGINLRVPQNSVKVDGRNSSIYLAQNAIKGDDGGYYIPSIDSEGNLTWAPSETEMPAVGGANIKGPKGDSGVWVGTETPDGDYNVWVKPDDEAIEIATKADLDGKQDKLTAGTNITIENNVISASGGGSDEVWIGSEEPTGDQTVWIDPTGSETAGLVTQAELASKQDKLTAGDNITIDSNNVISSTKPTKTSELTNDSGFITNEYHDPEKQNKLVAGDNITLADDGTISASQPTKTSELTNDSGFITNEYHDATKQDKLTAGTNITIDSNNVISATGSSGGGSSYTFTDGLTETDGVVKWDLNDKIKIENNILHGSLAKPFRYYSESYGFSLSTNISSNPAYTPKIQTEGLVAVRINNSGSASYNISDVTTGYGGLTFGSIWGNGNGFDINGSDGCLTGGVVEGVGANYNCGIQTSSKGSCAIGLTNKNLGYLSTRGIASQAFGAGIEVNSNYCMGHGICNIKDTDKTYAHIVGNGTSDKSRSNAYTLDWQGNGTFAGTVSSSTGADYAEYFEWKDGNPENEDRVGYIVTLDGDKIVKANSGDDILGICSGTAMVLGDSAEWNWSKRYLTDDFGRIIYEDYDIEHEEVKDKNTGEVLEEAWTEHIHAPKQNPDYDISQPYIRRSDRPEWQIVGMMGKLYVRDDGSCVVNGYADVVNGIATKATGKTNMRVMERINDSIVRVLLK